MPRILMQIARGHAIQGHMKVELFTKPEYALTINEHSKTHLRKYYYMLVYSF